MRTWIFLIVISLVFVLSTGILSATEDTVPVQPQTVEKKEVAPCTGETPSGEKTPVPGEIPPGEKPPVLDFDVSDLPLHISQDELKKKNMSFPEYSITPPLGEISRQDRLCLLKLIEAAKAIDPIYWKQNSPDGLEIKKRLEDLDKGDDPVLRYLNINLGPYDVLNNNERFIGEPPGPRPPGANLYLPDITRENLEKYIEEHPESKEELLSEYTLVRRKEENMVPLPYIDAYWNELNAASKAIREASLFTQDVKFKSYLDKLAVALLNNDYNSSNTEWLKLKNNTIDIIFGPVETYLDGIMNKKAAYEAIILIRDSYAAKEFQKYGDIIPELEKNLPEPDSWKRADIKSDIPIEVFDVAYMSGEANGPFKTMGVALPNDPELVKNVGSRKLMLRNIITAKYNAVLVPITKKLISEDQQKMTGEMPFTMFVLWHELSHTMGPVFVPGKKDLAVKDALKSSYLPLEECKADVMALYNVHYLVDKGWLDKEHEKKFYVTYLANLFRTTRFGLEEAHAKAAAIEFNFLAERGALIKEKDTCKFAVDFDKMPTAVKDLLSEVLKFQGNGDEVAAAGFIKKYAGPPEYYDEILEKLEAVPVDVNLVYKIQEALSLPESPSSLPGKNEGDSVK
ncbi:MAG: hypothetical protein J7M18_08465 [Candidatus Eremiobacteraeota bacterium]|nr:hypothetical protein [Candidatus Eremiobacteraeota bacterium]